MTEMTLPDFEMRGGHLLAAPAKTQKAIVEKLNAAMIDIMAMPETKAPWQKLAIDAVSATLDRTAEILREDHVKHGKIIRDRNPYSDVGPHSIIAQRAVRSSSGS